MRVRSAEIVARDIRGSPARGDRRETSMRECSQPLLHGSILAKVKTVPYQYRQEMHDDCARQTSGPYEIIAPVGAGGMGDVYRAKDTRLDRIVAIKVLPDHAASQVESARTIRTRARTIAGLNHPHICILYDVGTRMTPNFW